MYRLDLPELEYAHPWRRSFAERWAALRRGSPRIAYYYSSPDTSTFRYRVFNMVEALERSGADASASWFVADDGDAALAAVDEADVVVLCRAVYTPHIGAVIARARATGKRVVFDTDDLVFDPRFAHLIMETLDEETGEEKLNKWFGWLSRLGETLRHCDAAITTNAYLAARIRDVRDIPVAIVPNFMNTAQLELSDQVYAAKQATSSRDSGPVLGYFSGTPTHNRDFRLIEPMLADILDEDPSVLLRIVGFLDPGERLARHADRIEMLPLQDFVNLQRLIGEVEINLVPLQLNEFTNCKSELKYFEAAAVGTATAATPTYTYRRAIDHGETGYLVRAHEWKRTVRAMLDDLSRVEAVAASARASVLSRYTPDAQASAVLAAVAA